MLQMNFVTLLQMSLLDLLSSPLSVLCSPTHCSSLISYCNLTSSLSYPYLSILHSISYTLYRFSLLSRRPFLSTSTTYYRFYAYLLFQYGHHQFTPLSDSMANYRLSHYFQLNSSTLISLTLSLFFFFLVST